MTKGGEYDIPPTGNVRDSFDIAAMSGVKSIPMENQG